ARSAREVVPAAAHQRGVLQVRRRGFYFSQMAIGGWRAPQRQMVRRSLRIRGTRYLGSGMFGAGLGKDCLDVQFPAKAGVERSHALLQICAQPLESINVVADLLLVGPLRAAAVKGGRRPSRRDLPLTVASTTAES